MAKIPAKVKKDIIDMIILAEKDGIKIDQAFLFGSYAKGENREFSDIDVALISGDFEGIRLNDSMKLKDAILSVNVSIDPHPFRPEDFTQDNLFVKEILAQCIRLI